MNNPEKSRHIDIEKELRRMQGVDLLSTPKKGLSLQDRLRRNRQVEATVWNQVTLPGFDRTKTQPSPTREEETVIPRPNKARWITLPIFTADRRTLIRELLDKPSFPQVLMDFLQYGLRRESFLRCFDDEYSPLFLVVFQSHLSLDEMLQSSGDNRR